MGLLSKLLAPVSKVVSRVAPFLPIPGAAAIGKGAQVLSGILTKAVKPAAKVVAVGAGFEVGSRAVASRYGAPKVQPVDQYGRPIYRKRRGQGLSARDIRGCQKVARVVTHFGYKPKMHARRKRR